MSLRRRISLFFAMMMFFLTALFILFSYRIEFQKRLAVAEHRRYESFRLAMRLKNEIDRQTRMIRNYTLTADPQYLESYHNLLASRKERNTQSQTLNDDLLFGVHEEDLESSLPPLKKPRPVGDLLSRTRLSPEERTILSQVKKEAQKLASIERHALHLMDLAKIDDSLSAANRLAAQQVLHDARYVRLRRSLISKLENFFDRMDRRTSREVERIMELNDRIDKVILGLTLLVLLILLAAWVYTDRRIFQPMKILMGWTRKIREGDFLLEGTFIGDDEIAQLARAFRAMAVAMDERMRTLVRKAHSDRLTGLPNRARMMTEFETLSQMRRRGERHAVIMADLDFFKKINDRYGHDVGDRILIYFADFLRDHVPSPHLAARWGGEEFIILCKNYDCQRATRLAQELRERLEQSDFGEKNLRLTVSFGVAPLRNDRPYEASIKAADEALYRAKHLGRNRVESACGASR